MSREPISDERFRCPKWNGWGSPESFWHLSDGFRCCSHCGCIHHEDWIAAVKEAVTTGGGTLRIDRGKPGKWYVQGRAADGTPRRGKFYSPHMPEEMRADADLSDQLRRALKASWDRTFGEREREKSAVERLGDIADDG